MNRKTFVRPRSSLLLPIALLFFTGFCSTAQAKTKVESSAENKVETSTDKTKPPKKIKKISFLPVPFVFSDPNEGQTFGLRFTLFFNDVNTGDVKMIIAPKISYNTLIKTVGGVSLLKYFSTQEVLTVSMGIGQKVYREVLASYVNHRAWENRLYVSGEFHYSRDPFGRFFGIGNNTPKSNETDYVGRTFYGNGEMGYYFLPNFRAGVRETWNTTKIEEGILEGLPATLDVFGPNDSVESASNMIHEAAFTYDSRPLQDVSTRGLYSDLYFLFSSTHLGSDNSFHGFGFDVRKLWSFRNERFTTAVRGALDKRFGDDIPFYLQNSLGGPFELRGFPKNRFIDLGKAIFSVEERIRIGSLRLLGTQYHISLDPFFEVGEVFHDFSDFSAKRLQPVGGLGIRIKIKPLTLIRADIGFGREGLAFFVTTGYPF